MNSYIIDALSWKCLTVQLLAAIDKKKTADPDGDGGEESHQTGGGQQRQRSMSFI